MQYANPYTPGAGAMPAYLAGRDDIINNASKSLIALNKGYPQCRLPRYLTKPRQRRSKWDMAGSDGISRVSAVFRGKSLLTNKMRII